MILQGAQEQIEGIYYEIDTTEKPIGIGGMGRVYRGVCVNKSTNEKKPVAIKFMFEDLPEHAVDRARREASIQLRSDNLIQMLGFIETHNFTSNGGTASHYHVVSELLHGVCLSDVLQGKNTDFEGRPILFVQEMYQMYNISREKFAITIVKSVLSALMALHDKGYIHRDIDPSNIMLTSDKHIKLIDFGIAKPIDALTSEDDIKNDPCQKERLVGKMQYAAPELVRSDLAHQDRTTDIYAVGILLYQLLCGHLPFEGSMKDVMEMQLQKPMPLENVANPALRSIIKQATEKNQSKRFQSAFEFRTALDKLSSGKSNNSSSFDWVTIATYGSLAIAGVGLGFLVNHII